MEKKTKKSVKQIKEVNIQRSKEDWEKLVYDAKSKEMNWKYFKDIYTDVVFEREDDLI